MDAEEYVREHDLDVLMEDALRLGGASKGKDGASFLAEYFRSVESGTHVLGRELAFLAACPTNRTAAVAAWESTYAALIEDHQSVSQSDLGLLLSRLFGVECGADLAASVFEVSCDVGGSVGGDEKVGLESVASMMSQALEAKARSQG